MLDLGVLGRAAAHVDVRGKVAHILTFAAEIVAHECLEGDVGDGGVGKEEDEEDVGQALKDKRTLGSDEGGPPG